jgi:hypothetical protein
MLTLEPFSSPGTAPPITRCLGIDVSTRETSYEPFYRALVALRAEQAAARGFRYLWVNASDDSAPILQRLGLPAGAHHHARRRDAGALLIDIRVRGCHAPPHDCVDSAALSSAASAR